MRKSLGHTTLESSEEIYKVYLKSIFCPLRLLGSQCHSFEGELFNELKEYDGTNSLSGGREVYLNPSIAYNDQQARGIVTFPS